MHAQLGFLRMNLLPFCHRLRSSYRVEVVRFSHKVFDLLTKIPIILDGWQSSNLNFLFLPTHTLTNSLTFSKFNFMTTRLILILN